MSNSEVDSLFAGFLIIDLIYILYLPVRVRVVGEEDPPLVTAHRVEGFVIQDPPIRVVDPVGVDPVPAFKKKPDPTLEKTWSRIRPSKSNAS